MKAFVERLCEHAGIVRAGPNCEKYGDPYEYAVCYHVEGTDAVVKALVSDGKLKPSHVVACVRVLREMGLTATWERFKQ